MEVLIFAALLFVVIVVYLMRRERRNSGTAPSLDESRRVQNEHDSHRAQGGSFEG